jgi:N-acetylmuramoyl-L-alanine amidase
VTTVIRVRRPSAALGAAGVVAVALAACSAAPAISGRGTSSPTPTAYTTQTATAQPSSASVAPTTSASVTHPPSHKSTASHLATPTTLLPTVPTVAGRPLAGMVVGIDPGHNGRNYTDPAFLGQQIWNGRTMEDCDTTGTSTNAGYSEALFNYMVSSYLVADLRAQGATVVVTRSTNSGVGPCVNTRASIINAARARVAVDIHADGGPPGGRGFAILEPVADGPNNAVVASSAAFGADVRSAFVRYAGMPVSTYDGVNGIQPRRDLAGLNLTTVPKILIECGNMRNATDAALLSSTSFQKRAASALDTAIVTFLAGR